jgi:dienelactone hydrolase
MRIPKFLLPLLLLAVLSSLCHAKDSGPWSVKALRAVPKADWGDWKDNIRPVYYEGVPFKGKPTRVFAYYGKPDGDGPFPAMLLVHGGGGQAFRPWVEHWVKRGYVAIAMDLSGNGPGGNNDHLPDGGPDQSDTTKFRPFTDQQADVEDMWTYHAVADVILAHTLLMDRKEVDRGRIALTGISWGGYLTCIIAGVDNDLAAAVPVYGCGFLHENSYWKPGILDKMPADQRDRWVKNFDPSRYLKQVDCPILFVNGTNDFAYPLDSYQKCYRLVKDDLRTLAITIELPHGHIWTFKEVDAFVDSHLKKTDPLPKLSELKFDNTAASCTVSSKTPIVKAELNYTTDTGEWQKRKWKRVEAQIDNTTITVKLPAERPITFYLKATDGRGLSVSTPHADVAGKGPE